MPDTSDSATYHPEAIIKPPPIYDWPPNILKIVRYLAWDMLFPWGFLYLAMAFVSWMWLMPAMETMATLTPGGMGTWAAARPAPQTKQTNDKTGGFRPISKRNMIPPRTTPGRA